MVACKVFSFDQPQLLLKVWLEVAAFLIAKSFCGKLVLKTFAFSLPLILKKQKFLKVNLKLEETET